MYEFYWWLRFGLFLETHDDKFSDKYVSEEVKRERIDPGMPPDTTFHFYGMVMELGRINYDGYLVDGVQARIDYKHGASEKKPATDFNELDLDVRFYKTFGGNMTFAERFQVGGTNTTSLQYWYYKGGLDAIRGFSDNRFAGRFFWLSNTEARVPVYESDNLVLQTIAFYDVVSTAEKTLDLHAATGASVGAGVRFIAPKIYRLVARLDYAKTLVRRDERAISFGIQQFF